MCNMGHVQGDLDCPIAHCSLLIVGRENWSPVVGVPQSGLEVEPTVIHSAVTVSLVPESRGGPFVYWDDLAAACARAAALGFDALEIFPRSAEDLNAKDLNRLLRQHKLKLAAVGTGAGWVAHQLRLTDPDAAVRGRARAFVAGLIDFAGSFGTPAILGSM